MSAWFTTGRPDRQALIIHKSQSQRNLKTLIYRVMVGIHCGMALSLFRETLLHRGPTHHFVEPTYYPFKEARPCFRKSVR